MFKNNCIPTVLYKAQLDLQVACLIILGKEYAIIFLHIVT